MAVRRRSLAGPPADPDDAQSPPEGDTLTLIAKTQKLSEVAGLFGLTRDTAAGSIKTRYRKLEICSRAEARLDAARLGLVRTER